MRGSGFRRGRPPRTTSISCRAAKGPSAGHGPRSRQPEVDGFSTLGPPASLSTPLAASCDANRVCHVLPWSGIDLGTSSSREENSGRSTNTVVVGSACVPELLITIDADRYTSLVPHWCWPRRAVPSLRSLSSRIRAGSESSRLQGAGLLPILGPQTEDSRASLRLLLYARSSPHSPHVPNHASTCKANRLAQQVAGASLLPRTPQG